MNRDIDIVTETWIAGQKLGQGTGSGEQGRGHRDGDRNTVTEKQGQGV